MSCGPRFPFFFSRRRTHTRFDCDWSSDVCSSNLRTKKNFFTLQKKKFFTSIQKTISLPYKKKKFLYFRSKNNFFTSVQKTISLPLYKKKNFRSEERREGKK